MKTIKTIGIYILIAFIWLSVIYYYGIIKDNWLYIMLTIIIGSIVLVVVSDYLIKK
jgi:putative effector of murein hydrolase LrgA (UPF0299 family)